MRRLPIYFLIDVSESMEEEHVKQVENVMESIILLMRTDPYAFETIYLSVLENREELKFVVPLIELSSFSIPNLHFSSNRMNLDSMITELLKQINCTTIKTTVGTKGDWSPSVIIITDRQIDNQKLNSICQKALLGTNIFVDGVYSKILVIHYLRDGSIQKLPKIIISTPLPWAVDYYNEIIEDVNVIKL